MMPSANFPTFNIATTMLFRLIFAPEITEFSEGYKIIELHDEQGRDYIFLIDYDRCYFSKTEIKEQMAQRLGIDVAEIEIEEV